MALVETIAIPEFRARSRIPKAELDLKIGRILTDGDRNLTLTGPTRILKPNGQPLCVYLPQAIPVDLAAQAYPVLHKIKIPSRNRGAAAGSKTVKIGNTAYSKEVKSGIVGYIEGVGTRFPVCRMTAWTGEHADRFAELFPFLRYIAGIFSDVVPDRYEAQLAQARESKPEWVIADTPYTTITVNNTYATGVHQDAGDLDAGFSCLAVLRRGDYSGGVLTFPEWRIGVDLQDRDVILMDAHSWHGNTALDLKSEDAERISVVLYFREDIVKCGTAEQEAQKAKDRQKLGMSANDDLPKFVTTEIKP